MSGIRKQVKETNRKRDKEYKRDKESLKETHTYKKEKKTERESLESNIKNKGIRHMKIYNRHCEQ